jgi:hypothetical protein
MSILMLGLLLAASLWRQLFKKSKPALARKYQGQISQVYKRARAKQCKSRGNVRKFIKG